MCTFYCLDPSLLTLSIFIEKARDIYQQAVEFLGEEHIDQKVLVAFAKFEIKLKEVWKLLNKRLWYAQFIRSIYWTIFLLLAQFDRARVIFKFGLDRLPKSKSESLYNQYTLFEKQFGTREGIEGVVIGKRRVRYEEEIEVNPKNYDVWFDYARLEEDNGDVERVREVYERAIAQVPPAEEKRYWRRYIYLWINYALYEELETQASNWIWTRIYSLGMRLTDVAMLGLWEDASDIRRMHQFDTTQKVHFCEDLAFICSIWNSKVGDHLCKKDIRSCCWYVSKRPTVQRIHRAGNAGMNRVIVHRITRPQYPYYLKLIHPLSLVSFVNSTGAARFIQSS